MVVRICAALDTTETFKQKKQDLMREGFDPRLVTDPPPNHLFEVSEAGIAFAHGKETSFEAFEPGTVVVSPVEDNLLRADAVAAAIGRVATSKTSKNPRTSRSPATTLKKRKPAAVILPDYAARVTVLDFDSFPSSLEEQNSLVRFRVKKTIPFDIDSAAALSISSRTWVRSSDMWNGFWT